MGQAPLSYLLQSACLLLSPVEEIFLGAEPSRGVRGKMLLLGVKELIWLSTSGDGLSVLGAQLLNSLVTMSRCTFSMKDEFGLPR